jgi:hypothetical protein
MAYAEDLKSSGAKAPCGFESRPRHGFQRLSGTRQTAIFPSFLRFSLNAAKSLEKPGFAGVCIGIANAHIIRYEAARQRMNRSVVFKEGLASYVDSNE